MMYEGKEWAVRAGICKSRIGDPSVERPLKEPFHNVPLRPIRIRQISCDHYLTLVILPEALSV